MKKIILVALMLFNSISFANDKNSSNEIISGKTIVITYAGKSQFEVSRSTSFLFGKQILDTSVPGTNQASAFEKIFEDNSLYKIVSNKIEDFFKTKLFANVSNSNIHFFRDAYPKSWYKPNDRNDLITDTNFQDDVVVEVSIPFIFIDDNFSNTCASDVVSIRLIEKNSGKILKKAVNKIVGACAGTVIKTPSDSPNYLIDVKKSLEKLTAENAEEVLKKLF